MKYIRTENGIYKVDGYDDRGVCVCSGKTFYRDEYIKQADTIEELCDEFVFINVGIYKDKVYMFKTLEESKKCNDLYDKCYGAIWTTKGLIYVAKMNYKEKFELLKENEK